MGWAISSKYSHHCDVLPLHRPRISGAKSYELKVLNMWAKTNPSSFKLFMSGILLQLQKSD
jgi:hypothetical protein